MSKRPLAGGVWSATPTPFDPDYRLDAASVRRMVEHHVAHKVVGLMLAGTCDEGAWMRERGREALTRTAAEAAKGRLHIALQVTDNSALRILDNIEKAAAWGAEVAVVAAPYYFMNFTSQRLLAHFQEVARRSPLPVGLYEWGAAGRYELSEPDLAELLAEPNIVIVKDSSSNATRREVFLAARRRRPGLLLLSGNEFKCVEYIQAGYDGLLLGGGIFNASLAYGIIAAVHRGDLPAAERLQQRMTDLMDRVYRGPKIECWLTGLKELLVQMGIFSHSAGLLEYPLTDFHRAQIHAAVSGADGLGFRADLFCQ